MVREIIGNNDVTIPACSALHRLDKSGELENPSVNPATFCPTINVSNSGVVNVVGNRIENHYVIKKTAVTLESNQNTLTAVEKIKNFIFGDRRKRLFVAFVVGFCVLVGAVVGIVYLTIPTDNTGDSGEGVDTAWYDLVTRKEWGSVDLADDIKLSTARPINFVIITDTSGAMCFTKDDCITQMQLLQKTRLSKGLPDIGYSFLIGGDGRVFEGRGWTNVEANFDQLRGCSVSIAFLGNFTVEIPTSLQDRAALFLIEAGRRENILAADYAIFSGTQVSNGLFEEKALSRIICNWPKWQMFDGQKC